MPGETVQDTKIFLDDLTNEIMIEIKFIIGELGVIWKDRNYGRWEKKTYFEHQYFPTYKEVIEVEKKRKGNYPILKRTSNFLRKFACIGLGDAGWK